MNGEPIRAQPKPAPREKKARKPLARRTRLRARGKTSHARRERDFDYMGKVAKLPCVALWLISTAPDYFCDGPIEVDHAFGRRRKNSDLETIPLCRKHHREKTGVVGGGGFMAGWSVALRRGWLEVAVAWTRAAVAAQRGW